MQNISITDIVAFIGLLVMLWKTFLSKNDKKKLKGEADKTSADIADKYEDSLDKALTRIARLEKTVEDYSKKLNDQGKTLARLELENKNLNFELRKRDASIDCLEIYYRKMAQKAIEEGVSGIEIDPPCFNAENDDEEELQKI